MAKQYYNFFEKIAAGANGEDMAEGEELGTGVDESLIYRQRVSLRKHCLDYAIVSVALH